MLLIAQGGQASAIRTAASPNAAAHVLACCVPRVRASLCVMCAVTSPTGDIIHASEKEQQGSFDYFAASEGVHVICFENGQASSADARSVVHASAKITVGDPPDLIQLAKTEHLTPIEERIKNLHESMNAVRDLQDQMREQDEAQSKMTRSTRSWLLYFTLIEAVVLVAMTTWQNLYLKSFFEVKRVV